MTTNLIALAVFLSVGALLFAPRVTGSHLWRATVIPLASIIGSGFLVIAPILQMSVGSKALVAITLLVLAAYGIGEAIRFNISHTEPLLLNGKLTGSGYLFERLSDYALAFAYIISVTYYLTLFGDFALRAMNIEHEYISKAITTGVLLIIAWFGSHKGFEFLSKFEGLKLAVIASLIAALAWQNSLLFYEGHWALNFKDPALDTDAIRVVLGMLIIIQGFETSRYLGDKYDAGLRIRSMRLAQQLSGVIYIVFIGLMLYYFNFPLPSTGQDTAIITVAGHVATVLPWMLIGLALIAQFDAAVADTQGGGGLLFELSKKRLPLKAAYLLIAALGIALVWSSNVFQIIAYASRAFAVYYALQSLVATAVAWHSEHIVHHRLKALFFFLMALFSATVAVFGLPAG
jgi:hypothetical protein